jgi:hypothetical protein
MLAHVTRGTGRVSNSVGTTRLVPLLAQLIVFVVKCSQRPFHQIKEGMPISTCLIELIRYAPFIANDMLADEGGVPSEGASL